MPVCSAIDDGGIEGPAIAPVEDRGVFGGLAGCETMIEQGLAQHAGHRHGALRGERLGLDLAFLGVP